ncbi:hypothetical protein [Nonomuraea dietziae]|uniref:hypothetical protein n=1 Tax=Nonomuraea dietziae TaxID=65515 RepID=UPI0031E0916C
MRAGDTARGERLRRTLAQSMTVLERPELVAPRCRRWRPRSPAACTDPETADEVKMLLSRLGAAWLECLWAPARPPHPALPPGHRRAER